MQIKSAEIFENIYDTYSPLMYGIALEISQTEKAAEKILIATFQKLSKKNLLRQQNTCLCAMLIKLTIQTAQEQSQQKNNTNSNLFKSIPLIHKFLSEELTLESYCKENNTTVGQATQKIREEFNQLRNLQFQEK